MNALRNCLNENQPRLNCINRKKGVLTWLTSYPISDHELGLTKQQFWESYRLRYDWVLLNMPHICCCSAKIDVQHAMHCKRGVFVTVRLNYLGNLTANLLRNVCIDVEIERRIQPVTG